MSRKVIAFDADDTLWHNEPYFRTMDREFCELMKPFLSAEDAAKAVYKMQISNLDYYGYGIKSMVLSMVESAIDISDHKVPPEVIDRLIRMGQELIEKPVELLDGVESVLKRLESKYKLVLATKGDLLDQQRKLEKSGLEKYFHHIEVMSDKTVKDYQKVINHLDIEPTDFVMIGNSLKSDIVPVLNLGGQAFHVPYETTWEYEKVAHPVVHQKLVTLERIKDAILYL